MATRYPLEAGTETVPGYRLTRLLGRGGFAEVWEAQSLAGSPVALKFLVCDTGRSTPMEIRSLQAIRKVQHRNLIHIESVWCWQNYIVICMELADGSLADLHEAYCLEFGTPIVPEQVLMYMAQAAEALDFLNCRQHAVDGRTVAIQHCDVKPSNFLLVGDTIKLADFGLSSFTTASMKFHRRAGTLDYTPPEVFRGKLSDRTDQYSLAVSYCELRGGRLPFHDTPSRFDPKYIRPLPDLSMLPPEERPIISRALAVEPQERFPSCSQVISALAQIIMQ